MKTSITACLALSLGSTLLSSHAKDSTPRQHATPTNAIAAGDWASIQEAYQAGRHAIQKGDAGNTAFNPGQQWTTHFDGRGFSTQPASGGWSWGLELKSYGYAGTEISVPDKPVSQSQSTGNRLSYHWNNALEEWFINDARGLEHGFTVKQRPATASSADSTLTFTLQVRGTLSPRVNSIGDGITFQGDTGNTVVTYSGLKVWDADGTVLPAIFAKSNDQVVIHVEDKHARYPLTIDPIAQQAYLKASNTDGNDNFGASVAISGDTVVVGAPMEAGSGKGINPANNNATAGAGAAYVFVRTGGIWTQQAYLKASNSQLGDHFGASVSISGSTVVVGAPNEDGSGLNVNPTNNNSAGNSGAAYVFARSGTVWSQQAYLKASNTGVEDNFGSSTAISGNTIVIGAPDEGGSGKGVNPVSNNSAPRSGAAYVYVRSGSTWTKQAYLKASNTGTSDAFGIAVAISGSTIVVGADYESGSGKGVNPVNNNTAPHAGAAYLFLRTGTTWKQQAYLKAHNTTAEDYFGGAVSISGNSVVVGAWGESGSGKRVNPPDNNNAGMSGAAYVFLRSGTTWKQQAYLKAHNTEMSDNFGSSVAISGNTVLVGAPREAGGGTGINPADSNTKEDSGAAYVFTRSGTTWSLKTYIKAANSGSYDAFGSSVSLGTDGTAIIGAPKEAGGGIGVDPEDDNVLFGAGAAYIFTGTGQ